MRFRVTDVNQLLNRYIRLSEFIFGLYHILKIAYTRQVSYMIPDARLHTLTTISLRVFKYCPTYV